MNDNVSFYLILFLFIITFIIKYAQIVYKSKHISTQIAKTVIKTEEQNNQKST
jgi:hypothetical protein